MAPASQSSHPVVKLQFTLMCRDTVNVPCRPRGGEGTVVYLELKAPCWLLNPDMPAGAPAVPGCLGWAMFSECGSC